MRDFEFSARTVEQAVDQAIAELAVNLSDIDVEVLDEGGSGLLGFGRKPARIRVNYKPGKEPQPEEQEVNSMMEDAEVENLPYNPLADDACPIGNSDEEQEKTGELTPAMRQERVQKAVGFVSTVLRNLNIHGKMSSYFDGEGALCLDIDGDDVGMAIGRRGETLDALQYLTNLAVNHHSEAYTRVIVDIAGYRKRRSRNIGFNARKAAQRVVRSGRTYRMEAMTSLERRQVHMTLQDFKGINTYSEGDEPNRYVVIVADRQRR